FGTGTNQVRPANDPAYSDSRNPTGAASGDLGGTYPGPNVVRIQNNVVEPGTLTDGQVYMWDNASSRLMRKSAGGDVNGRYDALAINAGAVTNAKMANMPLKTIKGNNSTTTAGPPVDMTPIQLLQILPTFTTTTSGIVPPSSATYNQIFRGL